MLVGISVARLIEEKKVSIESENYWCNYYINFPPNKWKLLNKEDLTLNFCEFPAPTQSDLQKVLREQYNIDVTVHPVETKTETRTLFQEIKDKEYSYYISIGGVQQCIPVKCHKTYENALETGLFEVLQNQIKC